MSRTIAQASTLLIGGLILGIFAYFVTLVSYPQSIAQAILVLIVVLTLIGFLIRIAGKSLDL